METVRMTEETHAIDRDTARRGIVNGMLGMGFPAGRVDEVVDLAMHAVDEALETVTRILDSASETRIMLEALPIALQLLAEQAKARAAMSLDMLKEQGGIRAASIKIGDHCRG